MKDTQIIMGMPITIEIVDPKCTQDSLDMVFAYFRKVDDKFSTYKNESEISLINQGKISKENFSPEMKEIFELSEKTKKETRNYFNILTPSGTYDPSGIVKGYAIHEAGKLLKKNGFANYCIEAGGDIETSGKNSALEPWTVGIRNPFKNEEIVKVLQIKDKGIATSGDYIRGNHIYNPNNPNEKLDTVASLSVIGPNIYDADRFATAAFAMGKEGIMFIENLSGFEGYMIDKNGIATMTNGFEEYVK